MARRRSHGQGLVGFERVLLALGVTLYLIGLFGAFRVCRNRDRAAGCRRWVSDSLCADFLSLWTMMWDQWDQMSLFSDADRPYSVSEVTGRIRR